MGQAETPRLQTLADVDFEAAGRIGRRIELLDVRAFGLHAFLEDDAENFVPNWGEDALIGWDPDLGEVSNGDRFIVNVHFFAAYCLSWRGDGPPEDFDPWEQETDLHMGGAFQMTYSLLGEEKASRADLEHFAFVNGTFNAWPYWRELAHSLSQRLGIPRLVVPVLHVPLYSQPERPSAR